MILHASGYRSLHADSIVIGPGVTTISGPSDNGKSNFVRAFRDLCYGARGSGSVEKGQKEFRVMLELKDENLTAVALLKGPKRNEFHIHRDGQDEPEIYLGHGAKVPGLVSEALGIREIEVDKGVVIRPNLSEQHDPPFLLREPETVVAKVLGSISGLHVIFAAVREATNDATKARKDADKAKDEATAAMDLHTDRARRLEVMAKAGNALKTLNTERAAANNRHADLTAALQRLNGAVLSRETVAVVVNQLAWVADVEKLNVALIQALQRRKTFQDAHTKICEAVGSVAAAQARVSRTLKVDLAEWSGTVAESLDYATRCEEAWSKLVLAQRSAQEARASAARAENDLKAAQAEIAEIKVCPLCGGRVNLTVGC